MHSMVAASVLFIVVVAGIEIVLIQNQNVLNSVDI